MPAARRRVAVALLVTLAVVAAVVVVVALARPWLTDSGRSPFASDSCTFGAYRTDPGQASVAATMIGAVGKYRIDVGARAEVLVLAAALQESKLRNVAPGEGDRDSVGVLQQRPSQGWGGGRIAPLTDVGEATREFLDALVKVDGWQRMPAAEAIQAVQISADGSLYAQHEGQARAMANALSGRIPAGVSCSFAAPSVVASSRVVARLAGRELGIDTPRAAGPHSVRVPGAGWQTAAWFVANADRLGLERVAYDGRVWTRTDGWTTGRAGSSAVTATTATP